MEMSDKLILITLLVKLGVAAAVASALTRSRIFARVLFTDRRSRRDSIILLAFILVPLTLGVLVRNSVPNFLAADISFEAIILIGLLLGPAYAALGGIIFACPAVLHHEYFALPFNAALGLAAGTIGLFVEPEEIWSFSPLIDLSLYRWVRRNLAKPRIDRQILLLFLIVLMEATRDWIAWLHPKLLFALEPEQLWIRALVLISAPMVVGIMLKVWNTLRLELKLDEQRRLFLEARLDALRRQINPHFLFNTLNSIASLVRMQPELAREMTVKLASILRALLRDDDTYVTLRDELAFTDDYLAIEVVRFGTEKLKVIKEIEPETLDVQVPGILLQPLIENCIKHGLEPRIHGGEITIRSRMQSGSMVIEIEDDGVGIGGRPANDVRKTGNGIGMKNVRERLEVLYGSNARFTVVSSPGRGTLVSIEIPTGS